MGFSGNSSATYVDMNVTPLIDVLLVLLTIFMVIGPVLPHGLDSSVAQGPHAAGAEGPLVVQVTAGPDGMGVRYRVGQREGRLQELRPLLHGMLASRVDRAVLVQGDRELTFREVAVVAGEAKAAGAGQVGLLGSEAVAGKSPIGK